VFFRPIPQLEKIAVVGKRGAPDVAEQQVVENKEGSL
jgi:hypothetical protein